MKTAILVGNNSYPGTPLHGCIVDAMKMKSFLQTSAKFGECDCKLLPDASRADIMKAVTTAAASAAADPGSTIVFYYSGHGWAWTFEAGTRVSVAGTYSMICPIDWGDDPMNGILAPDLARVVNPLAASNTRFIAIFDCCESGGMILSLGMRRKSPRPIETASTHPFFEPYRGATSLTACTAGQVTFDLDHLPGGAGVGGIFTWALLDRLAAAGRGASVGTLIGGTATLLKEQHYQQDPQVLPPLAAEVPFPSGLF